MLFGFAESRGFRTLRVHRGEQARQMANLYAAYTAINIGQITSCTSIAFAIEFGTQYRQVTGIGI